MVSDSLSGSYRSGCCVDVKCEFCQTDDMVDFYKSLNPSAENVNQLITECDFCHTEEMVEYFKSLTSNADDASPSISDC